MLFGYEGGNKIVVKKSFYIISMLLGVGVLTLPSALFAQKNSKLIYASEKRDVASALNMERGKIMLDYEVVPLPQGKSIDLHGVNYLHQLNDWLYLGFGIYAPLAHGDYGGFMAIGASVHAQQKVWDNFFVDAGLSFGGGGGGSSIEQSKELSGQGGFIKKYMGMGYAFNSFDVGVNYANFEFLQSVIDHAQLNVFVQTPVSYSAGLFSQAGKVLELESNINVPQDNIFTFELNNIFQINPQGSKTKNIHSILLQFSHFVDSHSYIFFGAEGGYLGVPLYNHIIGGMGYRHPISTRINMFAQLGIGSGGYAPTLVDTGPGLLMNPKMSLEYLLADDLGLTVSGGYLFAPKGTFRNNTFGLAINYRFANESKESDSAFVYKAAMNGYRFSVFQQTEFNVKIGKEAHENLNFLPIQFDYLLNDYIYLSSQVGIQYDTFLGFPGNGEILFGFGVQSQFSKGDSVQYFGQVLLGSYAHGVMAKPSLGLFYSLNDNYALYTQVSRIIPLINESPGGQKLPLRADAVGFGLTYRFSLPSVIH